MGMIDRDRWRELEPLLDQALELAEPEREVWLSRLRTESPVVAADLVSLLSSEQAAEGTGFLADSPDLTLAGAQFGAYALERPLGRGGMGHVWLAHRADGQFEGRAAVKLLNLALLSAGGRARFRLEGSVLARLTHPGIARLLDAGVAAAGQPYLVLEYVEGERIDIHADTRRLPLPERIRLVLQVLSAVAHAHTNLIVHRDLKPSNILVTADGSTKLLDFGIAKLLPGDAAPADTGLTALGGRAHTPEYAAPEQLRGEPITTATDVFGAGVILYVLLTGRRPFDLAGRTPAEIERLVCDTEPVRPSDTFARRGDSGADDAAARAAARASTPERMTRQLRGDLDAIVMRAMRKEPERRYPSATALAQDLERYLGGMPVIARPESRVYRAGKFVGRHRVGVVLSAAAALLLAGAGTRERALRQRAEAEARTADAVEQYLKSIFVAANPYSRSARANATARVLLDRGAARIDTALKGQPAVQAELRRVFGGIYADLGLNDEAARVLERALKDRRTLYGERHPAVAQVMGMLGQVRANQGKYAEAEALLREALAQRRHFLGERDTATANSLMALAGVVGLSEHRLEPADTLLRQALAIRRALQDDTSAVMAENLDALAVVLSLEGRPDEAEGLYRKALAIDEHRVGPNHPMTADVMNDLAQVEERLGRYAEAERLYRRALPAQRRTLGDRNPATTVTMVNLGLLLARDPQHVAEGETLVRQALATDRAMFGDKHVLVAGALDMLGRVLAREGRFDEALAALEQSLATVKALFGPEHNLVATLLNDIGATLWARGDAARAIPPLRDALAQFRKTRGEKHYNTTRAKLNLAGALRDVGQVAEARQLFQEAASVLDTTRLQPQRADLATAQIGLGRTLLDEGRVAEARRMLELALQSALQAYGPADAHTAEALIGLADCLRVERNTTRSSQLLSEAGSILGPQTAAQPRLAAQLEGARTRLASAATPVRALAVRRAPPQAAHQSSPLTAR